MIALRLPLEGLEPLGTTRVDDVARARAYVAARRIICRLCGDDRVDDLRYVYGHVDARGRLQLRRRHRLWDTPIARLVQAGASSTRLQLEMAKCVVACRGCACRAVLHTLWRPQMLRCVPAPMHGVVAKAAIASGGGRNREPIARTRNDCGSLNVRRLLTESSLTRP